MYKKIATLFLFTALSLLPVSFTRAEVTPWGDDEAKLITDIRSAYAKMARYATPSARFELTEFQTIGAESFRSHSLVDLIDLSAGRVIQSNSKSHANGPDFPATVLYHSRWATVRPSWLNEPGGDAVNEMTFDDAIMLAGHYDPVFYGAVGLTTYSVRATVGSESRIYRGGFLWTEPFPDANGKLPTSLSLIVLDPVLLGLGLVLAETDVPGGPLARTLPESPCVCTPSDDDTTKDGSFEDGLYHNTGKHFLETEYLATCESDSACRAIVDWEEITAKCEDEGDPEGWGTVHRTFADSEVAEDEAPCMKFAKGKVAYACAVNSCPLGFLCRSIRVNVTIPFSQEGLPGTAQVSYGGATPIWKKKWESSRVCGPFG